MVNTRTYNKEYYDDNKAAISAVKKKRYQEDRMYRQQVQLTSIEYYNKYQKRRNPIDRRIIQDGDKCYYTIGKLAKALGKSVFTIRSYYKPIIRKSRVIRYPIMPDPIYYDSRGWRLFNKRQIILCVKVFKKFNSGELKTLTEVGDILLKGWKL